MQQEPFELSYSASYLTARAKHHHLSSVQYNKLSSVQTLCKKNKTEKALHNLLPSCVLTAGSETDDPAMKSPPSTILKNYVIVGSSQISGQAALFHPSGQKSCEPHGRGQVTTPTGSPHLAAVHLPLPPSRVIEELHRALATKHRQDRYLQPAGLHEDTHPTTSFLLENVPILLLVF